MIGSRVLRLRGGRNLPARMPFRLRSHVCLRYSLPAPYAFRHVSFRRRFDPVFTG